MKRGKQHRNENRQRKKKEKATRQARFKQGRSHLFDTAIGLIDLPEPVSQLLRHAAKQADLLKLMMRPTEVVVDPRAADRPCITDVQDAVLNAIRSPHPHWPTIPVDGFYRVLNTLTVWLCMARLTKSTDTPDDVNGAIQASPTRPNDAQLSIAEETVSKLLNLDERTPYRVLLSRIEFTAIGRSAPDSGFIVPKLEFVPWTHEEQRPRLRIVLEWIQPEQTNARIDGQDRPVFRAGAGIMPGEMKWAAWKTGELGLTGPVETLPVYIQSHALRRLHERLPITENCVKFGLAKAVLRPRCVSQRDSDLLVEFQLAGDRLGYLVATRLADMFVIKSFLFLTMQGTPEAELLRSRLKLCRDDVEHLGLDRPDTFFGTDLGKDPELVSLFAKCGCGHLLKWTNADRRDQLLAGVARDVRSYLGIDLAAASSNNR
jgi:hypothetical protein